MTDKQTGSDRIQGPFVGSNGAEQQDKVAFNYSTGEATFTYGGMPGFSQCLPPRSQAKSSKAAILGRKK